MRPTIRSTALAAVAAAALTAGPAAAKDFCTLGVPGCTNTYGGVQPALDAAALNDGPDRVLIGSGTWIGNFHANGETTIEGSGPLTTLTQSSYGSGVGNPFVLFASGPGTEVRNLRIKLPAGDGPRGLLLDGGAAAENVKVDGAGAHYGVGVHLASARFSGEVDLPAGNFGVVAWYGVEIFNSRLSGAPALHVQADTGGTTVHHSTLIGRGGAVVTSGSGALTMRDTLVDGRAPGSGTGISTYAQSSSGLHTIDMRHVTVLGHGEDAQSTGIDARSFGSNETVTVNVRDSVVAGFGSHALTRVGAGTANLSLDHVAIFPASAVQESGSGVLTTSHLTNADPGFAADGFTPAPGSPLIDAGTPGPVDSGESPFDLAGNPRVLAFGCGEARRDLGAIEAVGGCASPSPATTATDPAPLAAGDTTAPHVTKLRIVRRRAVRFALSEAARVTVRVSRVHHKPVVMRRAAKSGTVSFKLKRTLRHGRYAIRVIAVDGAGNRSAPAVVRRRI
jgi:hypothetical protein